MDLWITFTMRNYINTTTTIRNLLQRMRGRKKSKKVFKKQGPFKYSYDMGDYWEYTIKVEEKVEEEIVRPYCS